MGIVARRPWTSWSTPSSQPLVEMVISSPAPDVYEARCDRRCRPLPAPGHGRRLGLRRRRRRGPRPLADQDPTRFSPLAAELAAGHPDRRANSYPYAWEHVAQIFDHPCAPDLCVLHTAAHRQEDHRGEHGSLGVVQARAPFILAGAGCGRLGMVDRHCRLIDVAPTLLALLGIEPDRPASVRARPGPPGTRARRLPGPPGRRRPRSTCSTPTAGPPDHVVAILLDGCNPNRLYDMAATGEAPNVARLLDHGHRLSATGPWPRCPP